MRCRKLEWSCRHIPDELGLGRYGLSATGPQAAGKVRIEGKDYVMTDGDVVEFRFNV